jgi:Cu2+-exporting ATPase
MATKQLTIVALSRNEKHELKSRLLPITGMSCAACASSVESAALAVLGIHEARVNFATHQLWISYDPSVFSAEELKKNIQLAGYDVVWEEQADPFEIRRVEYVKLLRQTILAFVFAIPLMIIGMVWMHHIWTYWATALLATPLVFYSGRTFHVKAWKGLLNRTMGMDTLVSMSSLIAYIYSIIVLLVYRDHHHSVHVYFEPAGMIIAFILLGKTLEERARYQASVSLRSLMQLQENEAIVLHNGKEQRIPVALINKGEQVLVPPMANFPLDGIICEGFTTVDESMLTGESMPVEKKTGDRVFSGTRNLTKAVTIEVLHPVHETLLASMIQRIQEAQGSKAPAQQLADKVSAIFVQVILVIAIITFSTWMLLDSSLDKAIYSTVAVLIIACPCAMGLATPVAVVAAVGTASRHGILVKNAQALDRLAKINFLIIDKTGTITAGKPVVKKVEGITDKFHQSIFYSMELHSDHPLAKAITDYLKPNVSQVVKLTDINILPGEGIKALYEGNTYVAGKSSLFNPDAMNVIPNVNQQNGAVIFFGTPNQVIGWLILQDQVKPEASECIAALKKQHIEVMMATGDHLQAALHIATQVGIDQVKADLLPHEKAKLVQSLQQKGNVVAMVGDGVNDAESMALADVSIAMGSGSDVARDVADITLIKSNLLKIPFAVQLSKKTTRIIHQNLFWAFGYNVAAIPLAAGVFYPITGWQLNPMIAAAAMAFSSVSVVLNSLRLRG